MDAFHDDDFGELYATDPDPHNAIPIDEEEKQEVEAEAEAVAEAEEEHDVNSNDANVDEEKNIDSVNDDYAASDSDDDGLNIVLNDDDLPSGVAGCDDDGDGNDGHDRGSRFSHRNVQYMGSRGSMFVNNVKANRSMGMASYISSLGNGRQNGETNIQNLASSSSHFNSMCAAANPVVIQCGYGSFLPWYWGVFDVNMDTLKEKPWMVPGVDITDYFNFGFNETTWKLYCTSLVQLWQTSMQAGISIDDSAKLNQVDMREQNDQVISGNERFPSSDYKMPKSRAIMVEESLGERQPTMDIRRSRNRVSDIIQIKLVDSSDDGSGSGNSIVMDASPDVGSIVGYHRNIRNSSSDGMLSEEQLDNVKKSEDSSVQGSFTSHVDSAFRRSGPITGIDEDEHQDQAEQHFEDTAEVPGEELKAEAGGGIDTCSSSPCWIESELSLGDDEHSLTSYTDSDSEATGNSVHVDNEKSLSPLRRQSMDSVTDLKESLPLYRKNSKHNGFNRKAVNVAYCSRARSPFRKEWRHHEPSFSLNRHIENDNDTSLIMSRARDLSLLDYRFADYDRHKEGLQGFGGHKRRDVSYNRENKQSYYYGGETFVDDLVQTERSKYNREEQRSFRGNTNGYDRKNGDMGNYFCKTGSQMADSGDRERGWHHAGWGYFANELNPQSYRESRQFLPKHSFFTDKERGTERRRMNDKSHFRNRNFNDDYDDSEFEFLNKSDRVSTSAEREMESFGNKHVEQFPHIDFDWRSVQNVRYCDSPPLFLNNFRSGKIEDNYPKYMHHQTSNVGHRKQPYTDSVRNYAYGARVNENSGGCGRHKNARDSRGNDWCYGYSNASEDEDFIIYPGEEYEYFTSPSKFLDWTEDQIISTHLETHKISLHNKVQIDDIKLQQHRLNVPRRDSENCLKGSSNIMCRSIRGHAVLRCRKSVDLIKGEGESQARSSKVLCSARLEYVNEGISKKRRALMGSDEPDKKAIKFDTSIYESSNETQEWLRNFPDNGQKESSDIEEGQIVAEEPYVEASVSRKDVSDGAALSNSMKRKSQNGNNSDHFIGGYDSQKILDSLAKMEKRRERFKQPLTLKKEAEESLKLNNDSVDTGEIKQHRPARKRRWVG